MGSDGVKYEVQREQRLTSDQPRVWHGSIGSGEELVKDARILHALRDNRDLIGLEMEAAGIMNFIPVGVIRGVGNYRDEDKIEEWRPYAAAHGCCVCKSHPSPGCTKGDRTKGRTDSKE